MTSSKKEIKQKKEIDETNNQPEVEVVGGITCPIDPMERLQCESCQ